VPVNYTTTYTRRSCHRYELSTSGTQVVDLSSLPATGAKLLVLQVDADPSPAAQPVKVRVNGGTATGETEIAAGGFYMLGNPAPAVGISDLSLVYTSSVKLWVWAFG
jgi:hypothetical protein